MRILRPLTLLIMTSFLMVSCATTTSSTTPRKHSHEHEAPLLPGMTAKPDADEPTEVPAGDPSKEAVKPSDVSGEMLTIDDTGKDDDDTDEVLDDTESEVKPAPTPKKHEIPYEFNQKVADWIQYFSQKDRERFQRFLDRGEPYREVIQNILEENQVPADLYYLGMIESGFSPHAKSSAKAAGVWQFMRATGKLYGLSSDRYVDERLDPIRATEAAAKMLRDLYRDFHSWPLAMAAYNAGPGRIRGAIRRGRTNDFWELVEKKKLPRETMDYVPKFLAARYIGENPDLFAFYINDDKKYPNVELVKVPAPVPFNSIEKSCGMPEGTLAFVNPQYLSPYTHPGLKVDEIWVPEAYQKAVEEKSGALASYKVKIKAVPQAAVPEHAPRVYVVRRGDNLKSIARKRGLSVAYLKRVNGLKSAKILPGQRLQLSASSYHQKRTHPRKHKRKHH
jgi:membrane-bound lytic murein transglycosylase D